MGILVHLNRGGSFFWFVPGHIPPALEDRNESWNMRQLRLASVFLRSKSLRLLRSVLKGPLCHSGYKNRGCFVFLSINCPIGLNFVTLPGIFKLLIQKVKFSFITCYKIYNKDVSKKCDANITRIKKIISQFIIFCYLLYISYIENMKIQNFYEDFKTFEQEI